MLFTPSKGSAHSAGYDLKSAFTYEISPFGKCLVKTDTSKDLPEGCYSRIPPRLGLSVMYMRNKPLLHFYF